MRRLYTAICRYIEAAADDLAAPASTHTRDVDIAGTDTQHAEQPERDELHGDARRGWDPRPNPLQRSAEDLLRRTRPAGFSISTQEDPRTQAQLHAQTRTDQQTHKHTDTT